MSMGDCDRGVSRRIGGMCGGIYVGPGGRDHHQLAQCDRGGVGGRRDARGDHCHPGGGFSHLDPYWSLTLRDWLFALAVW
jgi:hypothetical protein